MKRYAAFLRGINVGSNNRVKMPDFKKVFEEIGLNEVQTFIQSGNVLFSSEEEGRVIKERLERGVENHLGIKTSAILRTTEELKSIISCCPFSDMEADEAEKALGAEVLYVCLFSEPLLSEEAESLERYRSEDEDIYISGGNVYMFLKKGIRASKLAQRIEKLGKPCTVRNLKMLQKLYLFSKRV